MIVEVTMRLLDQRLIESILFTSNTRAGDFDVKLGCHQTDTAVGKEDRLPFSVNFT